MSVVGRACFRRSAVAVPSVRPGLLRLCITAAPLHRQTSCKSTVNADGLTSADPFGVVTPDRAFLPSADPLQRLEGPGLELWEGLVDDVPKLAVAGGGLLRSAVLGLPPFPDVGATSSATAPGPSDARQAAGSPALWRAYQILSFLSHAYLWCDVQPPPQSLPAVLAVPWVRVSEQLGMPPVLCYCTYNLLNWRRLDPNGPVALGNIACLLNFLGGVDEEWFRLVHVDIEARSAPAIAAIAPAQRAAAYLLRGRGASEAGSSGSEQAKGEEVEEEEAVAVLAAQLGVMAAALRGMQETLARMVEKCDPYIYYHRVRLPMSGWRNNPALPNGLVYEGVSDTPVQFYGETGAQSSVVAALDAALGIEHLGDGWLKAYLDDMQVHMPPAHRAFIKAVADAPGSVRAACSQPSAPPALRDAYNGCIEELERFRAQHKAFAFSYIAKFSRQQQQQQQQADNSNGDKGTGGSDFMPALSGYQSSTARHYLV